MRVRYIKDGKFQLLENVEELDFESDGTIGVVVDGKYLEESPLDFYNICVAVNDTE